MTAAPDPAEQPVGESEGSSRVAGGCVIAIGIGAALGVVYVYPDVGTYAAGLVTAAGVRKARGWVAKRQTHKGEQVVDEADVDEPVDIVAVLQTLGEGGTGVLLTALREAAGLSDTKAVRALLDEAGIRVRAGVRTPAGNGPGVHADDIPAPSPTPTDPSQAGCLCSSGAANANTNNGPHLVQDETNPHRWHVVKETV
ncbi:hypothetical protein [Streptosporangium amethystogenes]|uniref:hypothetical protein n=1 Tax=Streptosporangium amethystogenes TaxID=2002 RepID=UPI000749FABD|nr:hypothetical protein [Streptosporangium amethystogenes]KUJ65411.1 hypothetical protein ACZ90_47910 [Streptomyces albus subsp. albus]